MIETKPREIAIVGGGPAGLMAAEVLSRAGESAVHVTVYDRMPSIGRKFLMAGRGGLNLTHNENLAAFMERYGVRAGNLATMIDALPPDALRKWCEDLGQETFVGSSGRVFPKAMKASPLLRAWLNRLQGHGVTFKVRHCWRGWDDNGQLKFDTPDGEAIACADATVLALGGGSWGRLGSDGGWVGILRNAGVEVAPLRPANCGVLVDWTERFQDRFQGQPLKRIALRVGEVSVRGEAVITKSGLEGGAVYVLSSVVRDAIDAQGVAELQIDLRPDVACDRLTQQLEVPRGKKSMSTFLRKVARLSPAAVGLLQEAALGMPQTLAQLSAAELARLIKSVPVVASGTASIERAISTAGGITFETLDSELMIKRMPGVFVAGEMLDWEAPTGGYLLQASIATGAASAHGVLGWLAVGDASG